MYISDKKDGWDEHVQSAIFAYNNSPHSQTGFSPQELIFGDTARVPSEFPPNEKLKTYDDVLIEINKKLHESKLLAALHLNASKFKTKEKYDKDAKTVHFCLGQLVFAQNLPKKGKHSYKNKGPHEILEVHPKNIVKILIDDDNSSIVHFDKLKHVY